MKYSFTTSQGQDLELNVQNTASFVTAMMEGTIRVIRVEKDNQDSSEFNSETTASLTSLSDHFKTKTKDKFRKYPLIIIYNVDWANYDFEKLANYASRLFEALEKHGYYMHTALIGNGEFTKPNNITNVKHLNEEARKFSKKSVLNKAAYRATMAGLEGKRTTSELEGAGESSSKRKGPASDDDEDEDDDYSYIDPEINPPFPYVIGQPFILLMNTKAVKYLNWDDYNERFRISMENEIMKHIIKTRRSGSFGGNHIVDVECDMKLQKFNVSIYDPAHYNFVPLVYDTYSWAQLKPLAEFLENIRINGTVATYPTPEDETRGVFLEQLIIDRKTVFERSSDDSELQNRSVVDYLYKIYSRDSNKYLKTYTMKQEEEQMPKIKLDYEIPVSDDDDEEDEDEYIYSSEMLEVLEPAIASHYKQVINGIVKSVHKGHIEVVTDFREEYFLLELTPTINAPVLSMFYRNGVRKLLHNLRDIVWETKNGSHYEELTFGGLTIYDDSQRKSFSSYKLTDTLSFYKKVMRAKTKVDGNII